MIKFADVFVINISRDNVFSILQLAVGVSFVNGPAELLARFTGWDMTLWLWVIFAYYVFATLLPIDKIIGKVHWIMTVPAMFLTDVCVCYLCVAPYKVGGLAMPQVVGNVAGIVAAFALLALFLYKMRRR